MATITRFPFVRHLRTTATSYAELRRAGRVTAGGPGASFWFRPLDAALSEVPVDDREQDVLVRLRTADLQEVSVPGTVTYRFTDPALSASRVDFSVDTASGAWQGEPLETVGAMVHGATVTAVGASLLGLDLLGALRADPAELGADVAGHLRTDPRLASIGVEVIGVRFGLIRPEPDVERALQTPAREQIQQQADSATYERRARAVEREAAIGENELANQIELARRREHLIAQQGANARREAQDAAAADAVEVEALAARTRALAEAQAEGERALGTARADAERARLDAHRDAPREVLLALAVTELSQHLPEIDQLVVTPDLVSGLLARLTSGVPATALEG